MILGHWGLASLARRYVFPGTSAVFMVAAAYGPDLLDKSAKILFGAKGRGPGHSLLAFAVLAGISWIFCRKESARRCLFWAGVCMWLGHLACDAPYLSVLLWPALGPQPPTVHSLSSVPFLFYSGQFSVPMLVVDLALTLSALGLWLRDHLRPGRPVAVTPRQGQL